MKLVEKRKTHDQQTLSILTGINNEKTTQGRLAWIKYLWEEQISWTSIKL